MLQPLDGPSTQDKIAVTDTVVVELKAGASPLEDRQVITIQPLDGNIRIYFGDGTTTPSASTVLQKGFKQTKLAKESYEAGDKQKVYVISESGTTNVIFAERS